MNRPTLLGQNLNAGGSRRTAEALRRRDGAAIAEIAHRQVAAGADRLDLCAAGLPDETTELAWLIETVQSATDIPLMLDSSNPTVVRQVLPLCRQAPWLNVCYSGLPQPPEMSLLLHDHPSLPIVAVCLDTDGPHVSAAHRLDIARHLVLELANCGISPSQVVFDPVTLPIATQPSANAVTLNTMTLLRRHFPTARILCAVGNYSYGLWPKAAAERSYAIAARSAGADVFLCDPTHIVLR